MVAKVIHLPADNSNFVCRIRRAEFALAMIGVSFTRKMISAHSSYKKQVVVVGLACLGLAAVVVLSYVPVIEADFVGYDDELYVTKNLYVQAGPTAESLSWAFTTFATGNWHPLTWISHMLDCAIYGLNPSGHHLTNLVLHCANTILLFLALDVLTGSIWKSAIVAILFGIHPLHVESVAWVSERKDVLSTLFWMFALLAYAFYTRAPTLKRYMSVAVAFVLGLLAKPMVVSLPVVLLVLDYWPLKRFDQTGACGNRWRHIWCLILEKLPMGALSLASCVVTYVAQKGWPGTKMGCLPDLPLSVRIDNAVVSYITYLAKAIWPSNLAVIYPHPQNSIPHWQVLACTVAFLLLSWATFILRAHHPYLLSGWLWYVVTLIPVIGIIQVGEQAMADRYTYIPLVGVFIAAIWYGSRLVEGIAVNRLLRSALVVISVGVMVVLSAFTRAQTQYWHDSISLFSHALRVTKNNYVAHLNLAVALESRGDYESARYHYEQALRLQPDWVHALYNYAVLHGRLGNKRSAMALYRKVVRIQPDHALAHYNIGVMYDEEGNIEAAIREYRKAIQYAPAFAPAHVNLAVDLYERGKYQEAWRHVQEAQALGFTVNQQFLRALSFRIRSYGGRQTGGKDRSMDD